MDKAVSEDCAIVVDVSMKTKLFYGEDVTVTLVILTSYCVIFCQIQKYI